MTTLPLCRDAFGYFNTSIFQLWTCSLCYSYLFQETSLLRPNWNRDYPRLLRNNSGRIGEDLSIVPDINDADKVSEICSYLDKTNCQRWKACCTSAISCCKKQSHLDVSEDVSQCPVTWDGYMCVDAARTGTTSTLTCPDFIAYGFPSGYATKTCTANGTWWVDSTSNREWTDYTPCLNLKVYKSLVYVGIVCSSISVVLLIPACAVFLSLRQLKSQHRIRLHTCLFMSFIMTCMATILWDLLIYNDRLDNPASTARMHRNTVFCRALYALNRYCRTCNFFWMFCEGFYLHRLMLQAFRVPKTLKWYYTVGWGGPFIPIIIYVGLRLHIDDNDCWVKNMGIYEWILYIPNLLCIVLNLIFLCSILRIMLTRLQCHPNEPSNYRRGLKATFLLVPLFGIQLFFITYRPTEQNEHRLLYEIISKIIIDSQGAIISLIFFYINAEAYSSLKHRFRSMDFHFPWNHIKNDLPPILSTTQMSSLRQNSQRNSTYNGPQSKKSVLGNGNVNEYIFTT